MNAIPAYHSWTTEQNIHFHTWSDSSREWRPIGPPTLEVYLHENATARTRVIRNLRPVAPLPIPEPYIYPSWTPPHSSTEDNSPPRDQDPQNQKDDGPAATVQHMSKPLSADQIAENYQLPREGNHTRRTAPTWGLPTGTIEWKEILQGVTAIEAVHLVTPEQIRPPPAVRLFISTQARPPLEARPWGGPTGNRRHGRYKLSG